MFDLFFSNTYKRVFILFLFVFTSYSFPQTAREWSLDNFVISIWAVPSTQNASNFTDSVTRAQDLARFKDLANCHIDMIAYPTPVAFGTSHFFENFIDYRLDIASLAGMRILITDQRHMVYFPWRTTTMPSFDDANASGIPDDIIDHYRDSLELNHSAWRDALLGYNVKDEPDAKAIYYPGGPDPNRNGEYDLDNVRKWVDYLRRNDNDKLAYINAGGPGLLSTTGFHAFNPTERTSYQTYLNEYFNDDYIVGGIQMHQPDIVSYDNYVSFDPYNYFWSLKMIKETAGQKPFWAFPYIVNSQKEVQFSSFCPIAYGAKGLVYYWNAYLTGAVYDSVQKINNYIKTVIYNSIFDAQYIGTYHKDNFLSPTGSTNESIPTESRISSAPLVADITGTNENRALVGIFYDPDNFNTYLLIVNKGYRNAMGNMTCTVTLKGNFQNQVFYSDWNSAIWRDDIPLGTLSGNNTTFSVNNLPPGQGQLFRVEGAILDDATISGTQTFSKNLVVSEGTTLTVTSGSNITFTNGASLIVDGTLTADGTAGRISFDFVSKGNANGITVNSTGTANISYSDITNAISGINYNGGTGTIDNCHITNCTNGILISSATPIIQNSSISSNQYGLKITGGYTQNWSARNIINNSITSNTSYGIYIYNSSPTISGNSICYNNNGCVLWSSSNAIFDNNTINNNDGYGIACYGSASASIYYNTNYSFGGYNHVTSNGNKGIIITGTSFPTFGYNSVYANTGYELDNSTSNYIQARYNYWGHSDGPHTGDINGSVNCFPFLSSDP